jgi:hypothetical protein
VHAGVDLDVAVVIDAPAAMEIEGVDITFRSTERVRWGKLAAARHHLTLETKVGPCVLAAGPTSFPVRLPLPPGLPASYQGTTAFIEHTLEVHVRIPWWLDRRAFFPVNVVGSALVRPRAGSPRVYATHRDGPRGSELAIELSLESDAVPASGTLAGAAAILNVGSHAVRAVRLEVVAREEAKTFTQEQDVRSLKLCDGPPSDGVPMAFRFALPHQLRPTFETRLFAYVWYARVVVEIALGSDVTLAGRFTVLPASAPAPQGTALPIGQARRSAVWAAVASRAGLLFDEERGELSGEVGGTTLVISGERGGGKSHLAAHLAYQPLGIDLDAHSRRWDDVFRASAYRTGDTEFDARIAVRGRFPEQLAVVLDSAVCGALLAFEEVHCADGAAAFSSTAGGSDEGALATFVASVLAAARALDESTARILPPPPMVQTGRAWREYAQKRTARFEPGSMSVYGAAHEGERIDVQTRWDGRTPVATRLSTPIPDVANVEERLESASFREAVANLRASVPSLDVGPTRIEMNLARILDDPDTVAELCDRLAFLATILRGGLPVGPYR